MDSSRTSDDADRSRREHCRLTKPSRRKAAFHVFGCAPATIFNNKDGMYTLRVPNFGKIILDFSILAARISALSFPKHRVSP